MLAALNKSMRQYMTHFRTKLYQSYLVNHKHGGNMANSSEWQCRNCGDHPCGFAGDKPTTGGKCLASGHNHVWMQVPMGTTNSRDWQCMHCGDHPSSFIGHRPGSGSKCKASGFLHVWIKV